MCSMIVNVHYLLMYVEVKFRLKKCSNHSIMELVFQCAVHIVQSWSSSVCRLPFTAIAMLLQLLQLICPADNKLSQSLYIVFVEEVLPATKFKIYEAEILLSLQSTQYR